VSLSLRSLASLATLAMLAATIGAAPAALAAGPQRIVVDLDDPALDAEESAAYTEACGFEVAADNAGHIIMLVFPESRKRMLEINVYGIRATYTNVETGASIRLRDDGPDRIYVKDGSLFVGVTGRSTTGTGVVGLTVIDLTTFEVVKQAGNDVGLFQDQLCDALAG